eukprot:3973183-Alexandrium_andersonii.AAC.1
MAAKPHRGRSAVRIRPGTLRQPPAVAAGAELDAALVSAGRRAESLCARARTLQGLAVRLHRRCNLATPAWAPAMLAKF